MPKTQKLELSDWQSRVWLDDHRYKVVNCGRRAGKSVLSAAFLLHYASTNPGSQCWYIAPTYRQAESIMWLMLKEILPEHAVKNINNSKLSVELMNGSHIHLKGADNPDSLRGVGLDLVIFDEIAFISRWDEVWKVMRPTLADSKADCWFISTPNGFNHFKDMAEKLDSDWSYHHYTTYNNPHIPPEEIEAMKVEMDEDSFAQEILGEFRKMSGLIYKTFYRETHMVDIPDIRGWTRSRAIDFGFGHKTACLWFAINSDGSEIYAYDGLYQSGLVIDQIAEAIRIKDGGEMITSAVGDSAQPLNIQELSNKNIHFTPVEKGPDSVKMGIQKVADLLKIRKDTGKPTLMFNKNLGWVAQEFERYRWMENKAQGIIKEAPLKSDDDAMDAIRYFAMSYNKKDTSAVDRVILRNKQSKRWSIK